MEKVYERAKGFIYRNARPLDLSRWQYHFENQSKEAVLVELANYQNEDGGFGHALEADSWNPNSTPIQTWTATEILRGVKFSDGDHPIIQGILNYLGSGKDFQGHFWHNTVKSNNHYPHAPWWHSESNSTCHRDYNPTASLAGFIIRFADKQSSLYELACNIAKEAVEHLLSSHGTNDMHTILCYIRLLQYSQEKGIEDIIDISALKVKLIDQVKNSITQDTGQWETSYICKPSQFFNSKNNIFYADNENIAEFECDHIVKTQLDDGSWIIPWSWNDYPEQWVISKNWWKSNGIIQNMLYLREFHYFLDF